MPCNNCNCNECLKQKQILEICERFNVEFSEDSECMRIGYAKIYEHSEGFYISFVDKRYYADWIPKLNASLSAATLILELVQQPIN
jgi:hypothetical protein